MFKLTKEDFPKGLIQAIHPTGSKYICNPPVLTTDEDYFALTRSKNLLLDYLTTDGWERCTEAMYNDSKFIALRKGVINLIVLFSGTDYSKNVLSTELAKRFNLTDKQDRIDLFELVRNGYYGDRLEFLGD